MLTVTQSVTITQIVEVEFQAIGKFLRHGEYSFHEWGNVLNKLTKENLGKGVFSWTSQTRPSYSVNQIDCEYAFREGSECKWLIVRNLVTGKEYAVPAERVRELLLHKQPYLRIGFAPFYVFYEFELTGQEPELPF